MPEKWTAIARTGTFTDSRGNPQTCTTADLDTIAASYDPAQQQAPLVFGHPEDNEPAFGWVQSLKREGQKLFASFAQVPEKVRGLLDTGRYKYVSMFLMPDRVTLRHVGLLGAARPAMDGLGEVSLGSGEGDIIINFAEYAELAEQAEQAKQGVPMPTPEELQQKIIELQQQMEALKAENAALKAKTSEAEQEKDKAAKEAETANAEFAAFRQQMAGEKREARVAALIAGGKIPPAEKESVLEFCAALSGVSVPVNFSAANGSTEQISAEERYWRELEARPVDGRFADFAAPAPAHAQQHQLGYSSADMSAKL